MITSSAILARAPEATRAVTAPAARPTPVQFCPNADHQAAGVLLEGYWMPTTGEYGLSQLPRRPCRPRRFISRTLA